MTSCMVVYSAMMLACGRTNTNNRFTHSFVRYFVLTASVTCICHINFFGVRSFFLPDDKHNRAKLQAIIILSLLLFYYYFFIFFYFIEIFTYFWTSLYFRNVLIKDTRKCVSRLMKTTLILFIKLIYNSWIIDRRIHGGCISYTDSSWFCKLNFPGQIYSALILKGLIKYERTIKRWSFIRNIQYSCLICISHTDRRLIL